MEAPDASLTSSVEPSLGAASLAREALAEVSFWEISREASRQRSRLRQRQRALKMKMKKEQGPMPRLKVWRIKEEQKPRQREKGWKRKEVQKRGARQMRVCRLFCEPVESQTVPSPNPSPNQKS
jgi:hypothetical protein